VLRTEHGRKIKNPKQNKRIKNPKQNKRIKNPKPIKKERVNPCDTGACSEWVDVITSIQ
jgi:hypothetical protein